MKNDNQIRVLLVDDHTVVRTGLSYVLHTFDDIQPVGEADSVETALEQCEQLQPDVVLMDMKMATDDDGIQATSHIRQRFPDTQVLILTSFFDKDRVERALQVGAIGYLTKDAAADDVAEAIRRAHKGHATLAEAAARSLAEAAALPDSSLALDLTARQREVLTLLAQGLSNREIARTLNVTHSTARHHVSIILTKLGVSNRTEAATLAVKYKLIEK